MTLSGDNPTVECEGYREALSARMDGEDEPIEPALVDAHLAGCAACRQWERDAFAVTRVVRLQPLPAITPPSVETLMTAFKSSMDAPSVHDLSTQGGPTEDSSSSSTSTHDSSTHELSTLASLAGESRTGNSSSRKPSAHEPSTGNSSSRKLSVHESSAGEPSTSSSSTRSSSANRSSAGKSSARKSSVQESSAGASSRGKSSAGKVPAGKVSARAGLTGESSVRERGQGRRKRLVMALRVLLGAFGAAQFVLGIAQAAQSAQAAHLHGSGHVFHESAAWNVAIGAGFAWIATRRGTPAGALPMLTAFVALLALLSGSDLANGTVETARLVSHGFVLAGWVIVLALSRPALDPGRPPAGRQGPPWRWGRPSALDEDEAAPVAAPRGGLRLVQGHARADRTFREAA